MAATIKVDALNSSASLKGVVTKVSEYAESSGWMSSSIKKYAVMVKIIDPPKTLKPGMNASVTIQVKYLPEALLAPIQTVYSVQDRQFCLAKVGDKWETLEVEVGGDNSQMVYFDSGAEAGTELVLNPGGFKEYMELPEFEMETKIELPDSVVAEVEASKKSAKARNKGGGQVGRETCRQRKTRRCWRWKWFRHAQQRSRLDQTERHRWRRQADQRRSRFTLLVFL